MEKKPLELTIEGFDSSNLGYGDVLNHSDIDAWSGIDFPDMSGLSPAEQKRLMAKFQLDKLTVVDGLRDYLLEYRLMYLESIIGVGYRIVQPAEQTEAAVRKGMKQIQKGLKHAMIGTEQVNTAMLSTSEREYNASVKARLSGLSRMIGRKKDYLAVE